MKTKLWMTILTLLLVGTLLTGLVVVASAMSSPNFLLDWYVNLTAAGGGRSSSTNASADFTIGQNAAWNSSSTNFNASLGYWAAFPFKNYTFLPIVMMKP